MTTRRSFFKWIAGVMAIGPMALKAQPQVPIMEISWLEKARRLQEQEEIHKYKMEHDNEVWWNKLIGSEIIK